MNILPLTSSYIFQALFSGPGDLLTDLVNAVLETAGHGPILEFHAVRESRARVSDEQNSVLEIQGHDDDGNPTRIEINAFPREFSGHEALRRWAALFGPRFKDHESKPRVRRACTINFLNRELRGQSGYHHVFQARDCKRPDLQLNRDLEIHLIQLPRFEKSVHELKTRLDSWLYMIKNAENMGPPEIQSVLRNAPGIDRALAQLETLSLDRRVRLEDLRRQAPTRDFATNMLRYYREGQSQGLGRGAVIGKLKTIQGFIGAGSDWNLITSATGISSQEYDELLIRYRKDLVFAGEPKAPEGGGRRPMESRVG